MLHQEATRIKCQKQIKEVPVMMIYTMSNKILPMNLMMKAAVVAMIHHLLLILLFPLAG